MQKSIGEISYDAAVGETGCQQPWSDANHEKWEAAGSAAFRQGCKSMFDYFHNRAANSWHADPAIQSSTDAENTVVLSWIADAMEELNPNDLSSWKEIQTAYRDGYKAGQINRQLTDDE